MRNLRFVFVVYFLFLGFAIGQADDSPKVLHKIAFGSCAQQDKPQPIWEAIVKEQPDLFLFIGDNIYGDTQDMAVLKKKYDLLGNQPGYKKLIQTCPILATWDDHDYGKDDAGAEYPKKDESQQIFLDFFGVPKDSPRRKQKGVYHSAMFGPEEKRVQIILLDTRYFRSPLKKATKKVPGQGPYVADNSPDVTMLGEEQWRWLEEQLKKPARLRVIASSVQVVPEDHGWEKWMNMPREREKLLKLLKDTKAEGVIFLSGDRHLAELSQMDAGVGYPIFDLTSSGLNQGTLKWRGQEVNRHRVATMSHGNNFGMIVIDWDNKDPLVRLQILDEDGDLMIQEKVGLSVLKSGTLVPAVSSRVKLASGQDLTPEVIKGLVNKECTLVMTVHGTGMSKTNNFIFLNSSSDRLSKDNFTVVLKPEAQKKLKAEGIKDLRKYFEKQQIQATGIVTLYMGRPELFVTEAKQISILKK